ncbi:hypothetical protein HDU97_005810 [Phlyctochytrium planicorne]|nr:hypothetical protein HDU97_005810 [Phlyctochytrium planicorne]
MPSSSPTRPITPASTPPAPIFMSTQLTQPSLATAQQYQHHQQQQQQQQQYQQQHMQQQQQQEQLPFQPRPIATPTNAKVQPFPSRPPVLPAPSQQQQQQQAAPKASALAVPTTPNPVKLGGGANRETWEHHASCGTCDKVLAKLYVYGAPGDLLGGFGVLARCADCEVGSKKRKEGRGELGCKLCGEVVGVGEVRVHGGVGGVGGEVVVGVGEDEGGKRFCTKCGGGGQWRTGRWRPKELFDSNRKTCSLPHLRLGELSKFKFVCYRIPVHNAASEPVPKLKGYVQGSIQAYTNMSDPDVEMDSSVALEASVDDPTIPYTHLPMDKAIRRMAEDVSEFWDMASVTTLADAQTMRGLTYASNWGDMCRVRELFKANLTTFVMGRFGDGFEPGEYMGRRFRRYVTLGFSPAEKGESGKSGGASTVFGPSAGSGQREDPAMDTRRGWRIVGCVCHMWDLETSQIMARFSTTLGQFGFHPGSLLPKLSAAAGERILLNRVENSGVPRPLFVWGIAAWGKNSLEKSKKSILPGMIARGSITVEDYARDVVGMDVGVVRDGLRDFIFAKEELDKRDIVIMEYSTLMAYLRMQGKA